MMRVRDHWHAMASEQAASLSERPARLSLSANLNAGPGSATTGTEKTTEAGISRTLRQSESVDRPARDQDSGSLDRDAGAVPSRVRLAALALTPRCRQERPAQARCTQSCISESSSSWSRSG